MKLEKQRFFHAELTKETFGEIVSFSIYYYFDLRWNVLDDDRLVSNSEISSLERAVQESVAYHATNDRAAWFSITELNCVVMILFPNSPRIRTRKNFKERILMAVEHSANAFKVAHNSLTLLLGRDAFELELNRAIDAFSNTLTSHTESEKNTPQNNLAVFALDIDYFKQVNDTYGHLYGNQVLKTFGIRLEKTAQHIERIAEGRVKVIVGHPSGEEFLSLVIGDCSRDEISEWANQFRIKIGEEMLPTDNEWGFLSSHENLSMVSLPPASERSITTSIGVAIHTSITESDSDMNSVKFILNRADTALYRAKAAGRNQVVLFDSILGSCGRILEQDKHTRIVALDIGSNVGVTLGQEFVVFPVGLNGKKKFSISDGRTIKTIGTYPRVELTRITVFNVQPELSFAFISDLNNHGIEIEAGAELEAIPAGSIGKIVPYATKFLAPNLDENHAIDATNLSEFVRMEAAKNTNPFAIVFRFSTENLYQKKYGAAALGVARTKLYREILNSFHSGSQIGVIDKSTFCVVGINSTYHEEKLRNFQKSFLK
jgi:diguanylate cyclase (GGDEF)-like protein